MVTPSGGFDFGFCPPLFGDPVLFNPKYTGCVYKVMVAIGSLDTIVWICPLAPGTSADVLIWDREGPKRSKGHYMNYEKGSSMWHGHLSVERR